MSRPIDPVDENASSVTVAPVRIMLEYRLYNKAAVARAYTRTPGDESDLATITNHFYGELPEEEGYSLHVFELPSDVERLRFDMFPGDPHYHYLLNDGRFVSIAYDAAACGDMTTWALAAVRERLPALLQASESAVDARSIAPARLDAAHNHLLSQAPRLKEEAHFRAAQ